MCCMCWVFVEAGVGGVSGGVSACVCIARVCASMFGCARSPYSLFSSSLSYLFSLLHVFLIIAHFEKSLVRVITLACCTLYITQR
jgi:hypothetical protein